MKQHLQSTKINKGFKLPINDNFLRLIEVFYLECHALQREGAFHLVMPLLITRQCRSKIKFQDMLGCEPQASLSFASRQVKFNNPVVATNL